MQRCPSQQELSDYLLGKLNASEFNLVAVHLKSCDDCMSRLDRVDELADSMVQRLRHPQADHAFMNEPQCALAAVGSLPRTRRQSKRGLGLLRDYRLLKKLGEGGMGTVYSAVHTKLDRPVAVKLLPARQTRCPDAVSRFQREMKAIGKLDHRNIVHAHDAGESNGRHYLVMELVNGLNLGEVVKKHGKLSVPDACEIVSQAAEGLQHAHENDLVHRDIKPSNLMITPSGEVKILDLGLARLHEAIPDDHELTSSGQIMGTLDYMAPEQLGDSHTVDHRADIYSLGATLYKLLTGKAPYANKKYSTPQKKLMAIATKPVAPVNEYRDDTPDQLLRVLDRMLAKNPDDRYTAASDVAEALGELRPKANLQSLITKATNQTGLPECNKTPAEGTTDRAASAQAETLPDLFEPEPPQPISARCRRRRSPKQWAVAMGALFLIMVATLTVFYVQSGEATLVVKVADTYTEAVVKEHGLVVHDLANDREWTIRAEWEKHVSEGKFILQVTDDAGLSLYTNRFTLKRGHREVVVVEIDPGDSRVPSLAVAPFDTATAQRYQSAWADYLGLPVEWTNSLGMKLKLIPPGEFLMGSSEKQRARFLAQARAVEDDEAIRTEVIRLISHEGPQHPVKIKQPFYLGKYEVTQAEWVAVMGNNPSKFKDPSRPVECVSWTDAREFVRELNQNYSTRGLKFVLPTEAQWEYAARAGSTSAYFFGDDGTVLSDFARYGMDVNSGTTGTVGQFRPNAWGLHDIYGNVKEWCWDPYDAGYYSGSPTDDPRFKNLGVPHRVRRGGGWADTSVNCRSANRDYARISRQGEALGFRLAAILLETRPGDISRNQRVPSAHDDVTDTDRQAAEWALRIGGRVSVTVGKRRQTIASLDLLPDMDFCIVEMNLYGSHAEISDTDLVHVSNLRHLETLSLYQSFQVTDEGLQHLRELTQLKALTLYQTKVAGPGLVHLKGLTRLEGLELSGTQITDDDLTHLKPMVRLTHLQLVRSKVTDGGLRQHIELPQLQSLDLDGSQVTDLGVTHLRAMKRLTALELDNGRVTDAVLARLAVLTQLNQLTLDETRVTNRGLAHLQGLPNLWLLNLDANSQVTDAGIEHLRMLSNLKGLRFKPGQFTEEGVRRLKEALPNCKIDGNFRRF